MVKFRSKGERVAVANPVVERALDVPRLEQSQHCLLKAATVLMALLGGTACNSKKLLQNGCSEMCFSAFWGRPYTYEFAHAQVL